MVVRDTGSPGEALEWIRRGDPFDVAILDMQMPEMDGLTLAAEIRRSRDARSLPLVLLTSLGRRKEELATAVEFGAYLTKPIKASQLFDALIGVFGRRAEDASAIPSEEAREAVKERPSLHILVAEDNEVNRNSPCFSSRRSATARTSPPTGSRRSRHSVANATTSSSWTSRCR